MYEDNENKINWLDIIKKVIKFIVAILLILGIITLISRCTKNDKKKTIIEPEPVSLKAELNKVQEATLKYITKDTLPNEIGASKTIKLKYLINKGLIETVKDATGTKCDDNGSYSEITKLSSNYAIKTTLTCGKNKDTKIIYIGCFESCNGGICVGNQNDKGLCIVNNDLNNGNNNNKETTPVTSSNSNNGNNKNNQTSTNNQDNNNRVTENKTPVLESKAPAVESKKIYEYKKTNKNLQCKEGLLSSDGVCAVYSKSYLTTKPIENKNTEHKTEKKAETITTKDPTKIKNSSTVTYTYLGYENGYYKYRKTYTVSVPKTTTTYSCNDTSYTYNKEKNVCEKTVIRITNFAPIVTEDYEYKWSSTDLGSDWVKTGKFKLE